ncbi:hypothetical protein P4V39_21295 [Brevibacillus borstelensis]|uniref:hypothetical protein n=1 Tax=Brevibacillus borstelensis TaxID=45462 RepID=UPI002E1A915E|nr:hypothetical protein [Brevibacillus borstelensis]
MRTWALSVSTALLICGSAWAGYMVGTDVESKRNEEQAGRVIAENEALRSKLQNQAPAAEASPPANSAQQPAEAAEQNAKEPAFIDHDAILDAFRRTDDKGGSFEITEEDKQEMMAEPRSRDYKWVLRTFVEKKLGKKLNTFQTTSQTVNPRILLATTTDGTAYEIEMKKWAAYDQIWTVERFNGMSPRDVGSVAPLYRAVKKEEVPKNVQDWLEPLLASPEWKTEYLRDGKKTYVLIKTSSSPADSVEVEDVSLWVEEVTVKYQTYDYANSEDRLLANDYVLLEIPYEAADGVQFTRTLSIVR